MDPVTIDRAKLEELLAAAETILRRPGWEGARKRLDLAVEDVKFDLARAT